MFSIYSHLWPATRAPARDGLQDLQPGLICAGPRRAISHHPRREEYTTCAAGAPDAVLAARR